MTTLVCSECGHVGDADDFSSDDGGPTFEEVGLSPEEGAVCPACGSVGASEAD